MLIADRDFNANDSEVNVSLSEMNTGDSYKARETICNVP